jgi:hypothetical protein
MLVVIIETWAGKTEEQEIKTDQRHNETLEEIGAKPEELHIIIHDIPKINW